MGALEIISASAGSGKTYRLATALEEAVTGTVRPEAVLATTFTIKAAEELRHRARARLVKIGRLADAQRLEAARIGTIHSVCNRIVRDFAFEQGCSPALGVLDPAVADAAIRRAQSDTLDEEATEALAELSARINQSARDFDSWSWQTDVDQIIDLARDNGLDSGEGTATLSDTATLTIEITAVNDAPVAADQSFTIDEEGTVAVSLDFSDNDAGDSHTCTVAAASIGTYTQTNCELSYTGSYAHRMTVNRSVNQTFWVVVNGQKIGRPGFLRVVCARHRRGRQRAETFRHAEYRLARLVAREKIGQRHDESVAGRAGKQPAFARLAGCDTGERRTVRGIQASGQRLALSARRWQAVRRQAVRALPRARGADRAAGTASRPLYGVGGQYRRNM